MEEIKILIVEDDNDVINQYKRNFDTYNATNDSIKFSYDVNKEEKDAFKTLNSTMSDYDGAIVDLDLRNSNGEDKSGNDVIRKIKESFKFPVFVISGTTYNIDDNFKKSVLFQVVDRDNQDFDYIKEFIKIYDTGITKILGKKGEINSFLTKIFWEHLADSMKIWTEDDKHTSKEKQKSLLRYTLANMQEHLELNEKSDFEKYIPVEVYIKPPVNKHIFTGDLIMEIKTKKRYIVLTPSCDLAQTKTDKVLLVNVQNIEESDMQKSIDIVNKKGSKKNEVNNAKSKLINYIKNNKNKNHFIPPCSEKDIAGGLVNFQNLECVSKIDADNKKLYERIASLNNCFVKDIIARFSQYYSRQGSPDFDNDYVLESLFENKN